MIKNLINENHEKYIDIYIIIYKNFKKRKNWKLNKLQDQQYLLIDLLDFFH